MSLISKQIDELRAYAADRKGELAKLITDAADTIEMLSAKQPEQRWIPCSERLPDDDTLMLVNYIDNRPEAMDIWIGWHEMENVWYIDGEAHSKEDGNEVIAWMPLPEPYREEGDCMDEGRFKRECEEVKRLGDQIGYGNMMTIASALWAKMLIDEGWGSDSGAFYPTILTNMKPGDLTVHSMSERASYLELFKKWGW